MDGAIPAVTETTEADDVETDYAGKLYNISNLPKQPDYLLGLATGRYIVSSITEADTD